MARKSEGRSGWYWQRVTHYPRVVTETTSTGYKRASWAEAGDTWWCYTTDAKVQSQLMYGVENKTVEIEVHIRGYPDIDPLDRLQILTNGRYCEIKGIKYDYDNGETIALAVHVPTLEASA